MIVSETRSEAECNPRGLVYIVQNDMHPDAVFKVGQTYRSVEKRLQELNRETSNPGTFEITASFPVSDRFKAEKDAHHSLRRAGLHHKREFFKGDWDKILQIVEDAAKKYDVRPVVKPPEIKTSDVSTNVLDTQLAEKLAESRVTVTELSNSYP